MKIVAMQVLVWRVGEDVPAVWPNARLWVKRNEALQVLDRAYGHVIMEYEAGTWMRAEVAING